MTINDTDIDEIIKLISKERLDSVSKTIISAKLAIQIHQEILSLNGALMSSVASVEIALRNTAYQNLNQHFKKEGWFLKPPPSFNWEKDEKGKIKTASRLVKDKIYSKMTKSKKRDLEQKTFPNGCPQDLSDKDKIRKIYNKIPIADEQIIAELNFSFWMQIYTDKYEYNLWKPTLRQVFPNKTITRANVSDNLDTIHKTRNRLAHHEPVLFERFDDTIKAIQFIAQNLNQRRPNPNSPLAKLLAPDIAQITAQADRLHRLINAPAHT